MASLDSKTYDPGTVPEWARESIARIAREHPENLDWHLGHVAEIEAARRFTAEHPPSPPPPPASERDFLHLAAIEAWQAIATGKPAPVIDPVALYQEMCEAFGASDGVDQFYCRWEEIADRHGFPVQDEHGDLLPEVDDAITGLITAAIWFGITTGYLTLTGTYRILRKFAGWR